MQREYEDDLDLEAYGLAAAWMRTEAFRSLAELNEQCLELLAEQSTTRLAQGSLVLRQIGDLWRTLDASARHRAASCPYLLVDAGFADVHRWRWAPDRELRVGEVESGPYRSYFTVPRALGVARQVFTYAWHMARTHESVARLVLGMPAQCTGLVSSCTVKQIYDLAERHTDWLKPRWASRSRVWREMLLAAASGEGIALERARMHGLQLLAAEVRAAALP